jgi:gluconolactonase
VVQPFRHYTSEMIRASVRMGGEVWILALAASVGLQGQAPAERKYELKAESPSFWKLVAKGTPIKKVAGGFGFTEGPVWDERGFLYVSDERQYKIFKVYPDGRTEAFSSIKDPDGSAFDKNGRLIDCASGLRAVIAVEADGTYKVLADRFEGKKFNSPNDVVLGPDGALYFTDPTLDLPKGETQELEVKGVYRLGDDGSLKLLIKDLNQPNGLAFSPDGRKLYVDDSRGRDIHVYDVAANGEMINGRLFGKEEGPPRSGGPDGMKVDTKGNIFVTGPYGIWVWDPQGHHIGTIMLPEGAANLAWGDADYKTLYITATTSVYSVRTKTRGYVPGRRKEKVRR